MKYRYAIGVDLGGTNLRVGVVRDDGAVMEFLSVPVGKEKGAARVARLVGRQVSAILKKMPLPVVGCGMGVPGIVDADRGIVYSSPNFPLWKDTKIIKLLQASLKVRSLPIIIDNDANMFALGEHLFGAGRGSKNLILLTLGSGIGGGIIIDGKIFHGDRGFAGEVGHMTVEPDGARCSCGNRGCFEQYAASHAFKNLPSHLPPAKRKRFSGLSPEQTAKAAIYGDKAAQKIWGMFGRYLGIGIASLINAFGITTFVIGGGIARSWDLFINATLDEIAGRTYKKNVECLRVLPARLEGMSAVIGAASAALQKFTAPKIR